MITIKEKISIISQSTMEYSYLKIFEEMGTRNKKMMKHKMRRMK
jgi:hypothetical protein